MPEKGWDPLTVRRDTAVRVRELVRSREMTIDKLINELMRLRQSDGWVRCNLCGAKVNAENMPRHVAKVHPTR